MNSCIHKIVIYLYAHKHCMYPLYPVRFFTSILRKQLQQWLCIRTKYLFLFNS